MAKYPAIEGFSKCYGVSTSNILPTDAEKFFLLSGAVNRSTYSLLNATRPPFEEIFLKFQSTEEEYTFRNAAITGMKFYQGEAKLFSSFLIVAVGDRIMAGYIKAGAIEFFTIYNKIDPQWVYTYFGKALNILTVNNGKTPGLYWTGKITDRLKFIYDSKYVQGAPMPVSNISEFAHGRIHVATEQDLVYSSNFITAAGLSLEQREGVLSFKESEYPSSGDGFGSPAEFGPIRCMKVMAKSDQINGHGDLMIGCSNGFFSLSPGEKVRSEWTNDPGMQKISFEGKGCVAHHSIITWGNQVFYRDTGNDISSLNADIAAYQSARDFESVSQAIEKYTDYDANSSDIQGCSAFTTSNRMLMTVGHMKQQSVHMGVHRYANGMISACRQKRENGTFISWEGLWTGPRVIQGCKINIGGYSRTIVASFDTDNQNRLYFLNEYKRGDDYRLGEYKPIKGKFSYSSVFFDSAQNTPLVKKKLEKIDMLLVRSNPVSFTLSYSNGGMSEIYGVDSQLTEFNGCGLSSGRVLSRDITPSKSKESSSVSNEGYYFTVNCEVEGIAEVAKTVIGGSVSSADGFEQMLCSKVSTPVLSLCFDEKVTCGTFNNDFSYQF